MFHSELPDLTRYPYWAFDTETTGLEYPKDYAFGLSLAVPTGDTWYIDLRIQPCYEWWEEQVTNSRHIIGFNVQFDCNMMWAAGYPMPVTRALDDAMVRACLIDEHLSTQFPWPTRSCRYSLEDLAQRYLGEGKDEGVYEELSRLFGGPATRSAQIGRLHLAPPEIVAPYARRDALVTLRLWEWQRGEIDREDLHQICEFEQSVLPTVIRTARRGVRVDPDQADRAMVELTTEIALQQKKLDIIVGRHLNVNSSPQVRDLFSPKQMPDGTWVADNGTILGQTEKGLASVNHEALTAMENDPRAALIDEVRSLTKTRDTFLGKYIRDGAYNGHVYPSINQVAGEEGGTKTGRFSYTAPALQQIPNRNKRAARIVKSCFLPPEGMVWVDGDLASYEVRVFAHLVARYNDALARAYHEDPNLDFHKWVAEITGLPRNPPPEGGANAKQLNLSMIFNSGNGAIAHKMGMDWEWAEFSRSDNSGETVRYRRAGPRAMEVIDRYHSRVQGVKVLADRMSTLARARGFISTEFGRRLRFPKGYKAYKASGLLIQATAADINKENWLLIEEALDDDGHLILNTHDSYSMAINEDTWRTGWGRVKDAVERPVLRVPLILELSGKGRTWWDAMSSK